MSTNDGFILVKYKRPRQSRGPGHKKQCSSNSDTDNPRKSDVNDLQLDIIIKYIESCKVEIKTSHFYEELVNSLQEINSGNTSVESKTPKGKSGEFPELFTDFVCYGIGQLSESPVARYQLALLLLLWEHFKPHGSCYIYDPIFTSLDELVIKHFKLVLISKNEEAKRKVFCKTLFFIPHGGKPLYNNVLWSNWGLMLSNIVLIGNSFQSYHERIPSHQLDSEALYISQALSLICEIRFPVTFHHQDIFNDLSIHFFEDHKLESQSPSFWQDCEEPFYDDDNVEIILN